MSLRAALVFLLLLTVAGSAVIAVRNEYVTVPSSPAGVGDSFALTCRAAGSLALWEQHSVQPAAQRHFGRQCDASNTSAAMPAGSSTAC